METLYKKLVRYGQSDYYPFHMPGHKRNSFFLEKFSEGICEQSLQMPFSGSKNNAALMWNSYGIDITEIEGFDNLHDANGILADAMARAARVCGAGKSYFLVTGSTCGLLAGISACVQHGDTIIAARNCHKAVYHAIELNELVPHYIYPQEVEKYGICGGISSKNLREMLITYPDTKLVVITSPTYEGVVSDIQALADTAHKFGVPLLVDEAHGAHFGHAAFFPKSALSCGADIVIQSMHKTMPAFTQTALLHLGFNTMADKVKIEKYLSIYQTSSPSYLFMASIDWCMEFLEQKPEKIFEMYEKRLKNFYNRMGKLKELEVFYPVLPGRSRLKNMSKTSTDDNEIFDFDFSKINLFVKASSDLTGSRLYDILLKQYHLQMEMVSKNYVLAMTSICDTEEGMERLAEALEKIDKVCMENKNLTERKPAKRLQQRKEVYNRKNCIRHHSMKYTPYQVQGMREKSVLFTESWGNITKEYIYLYPPGIPLLVPGEEITLELIEDMKAYQKAGLQLCGIKKDGSIVVTDE